MKGTAVAAFVHMLLALLVLSGCGKEPPVGSGNAGEPSATEPQTRLTIRVTPEPDAQTRTWTLTCQPSGGSHPAPEAACAALRETADPFKPVPPDAICTQIFGGPQTAVIEGTWRGEQVHATYNRVNGCEIQRWDAIKPVLQPKDASPNASPESG